MKFENFPELQTERLKLVEIRQCHRNDYYRIFSDKRVTKYYNIIPFSDEEEAQKYLDWFKNRLDDGLGVRWGIAFTGDEKIIGTLGFNNYQKNHRANIGYDLHADFWNKGIITEALKEVIRFGFETLEINRIEAEVMPDNIASVKVLLKLGFTEEGILRDWMYWNDRHYDMTMFSLLKNEYKL